MEEFLRLPQNLQTQENLERLLVIEHKRFEIEFKRLELEQKRLDVQELWLKQTGSDFVTRARGHGVVCIPLSRTFMFIDSLLKLYCRQICLQFGFANKIAI